MEISPNQLSNYASLLWNAVIEYSPKIISAFIILIIGIYAIRLISRIIKKIMVKRELDPTLTKFLADILIWALRILLFIAFISKLGIETSSFVAILGAMGLAVGLSLQGSLSNFAGGMLIILFKPFKVGDTIEAQGQIASVLEIQIFVTKLLTANNQTIFIPNGILSNGTIINYSMQGQRRADLTIAISYATDIKKAKDIITEVLRKNPKILQQPAADVSVKNLTDNAIQLAVRPWAKNEDFWAVYSDTLEQCKEAFDAAGIVIQPYVRESSLKN
ncbi:small conductance mechanosensitive channel [Flavobacterium succinicans]|jgi:small conductance mechanosensitive channel|uniref:Small conductance mechanosensitive channel n=1 Tax=Flavobacterium succinicans TaxID=29536 RepID=A0A1I4RWK7_9FLAO|nr:mechanosensitive ion channel domain-containing protein [Flavobacterium succinicans]SFM56599.1 small conductance mechanosensitive channel [Flavobacterium succinicans]